MVDGEEIRNTSIQQFVLDRPECISLTISHSISLLWDGVRYPCELKESFIPSSDNDYGLFTRLSMSVDGMEYDSGDCNGRSKALIELHEAIGDQHDWWFATCFHCFFSGAAVLWGGGYYDNRCYRDAPPEVIEEVHKKGQKFAAGAFTKGEYFADIFHTCPAWRKRV